MGLQVTMPSISPEAFRHIARFVDPEKVVKLPSLVCGGQPSDKLRSVLEAVKAWAFTEDTKVCS